ncbi:MAG: DNA gyrase subunit A, partial [Chloroflexi bacterium]|nr:DNA gyrase subunit A [Chloroflexota bacterium]
SAIRLDEGDELGWVSLTRGEHDVLIVTAQGQALRFGGDTVRPMGRAAAGVNAIKLDAGDHVADACVIAAETYLLVVTTRGYAKRTPLDEFAVKGRYGKGVRCLGGQRQQTGLVAAARVVRSDDEVSIISAGGVALHAPASDVPQMGRATRGARVIELKGGDGVSLVAVVSGEE